MKNESNETIGGISSGYTRRRFIAGIAATGAATVASLEAVDAVEEKSLPMVLLPYLQHPTAERMTVCLPSKSIREMKVFYKEVGGARSVVVEAVGDEIPDTKWKIWKARMDGLKPGKSYEYVIQYKSEGKGVETPRVKFTTFDANGEEVRCAVFNDIHNKIPTLEAVLKSVKSEDFEFTVLNGDMENNPKNAEDVLWVWNEYVRLLDGGAKPMIFLRGNHELRGRFRDNLAYLFDLPNLDLKDNPDEYRYECDWKAGPIHFIATDTGEDDDKNTPKDNYRRPELMMGLRERQAKWLKGLSGERKESKFRVFVSHIPLYNTARWFSLLSRDLWLDSVEKLDVDLALAGHDHSWKFVPANESYEELQGKDGPRVEVKPKFPTLIGGGPSMKQGSVILVHADSGRLTSKMYNTSGDLLHTFKS